MTSATKSQKDLLAEIEDLRFRLEEAEETLRAIGSGEVDAFVVSSPEGQQQVFTLKGAEQPYRILVESMNEGATTMAADGTILYCNKRLSSMLKIPLESLIGTKLGSYVTPADHSLFLARLAQCSLDYGAGEITMLTGTGTTVPMLVSCCANNDSGNNISMILTDLTLQKRNAEILASEKFSTSIIEQSSEAMIVCDANGKIIRASQSAHTLCGTNPLLKQFDKIFPMQITESGEQFLLEQHIRAGKVTSIEVEFKRDNEQIFNLLLNATNLKSLQNHDVGSIITLTDITGRKTAEMELQRSEIRLQSAYSHLQVVNEELQVASKELKAQSDELQTQNQELHRLWERSKLSEEAVRQSEERLALATSATQIGMFDNDLISGKVLWTQTHAAIFGYAPATTTTTTTTTTEYDSNKWSDRVHPDDLPHVKEEGLRCMIGREPVAVQYRIFWPDGSLHWVETRGVYQYDGDGNASRLLGVVIDITDRKLTDDALKKSEEFNRRVIASSKDCIKVLDLEGHILSLSEGGLILFEIEDVTQFLGLSWIDFWKEDIEGAQRVVAAAVGGEVGCFYGYCPTVKGTPKWWEVVISPIMGADNKIENLLAVSRDITERLRIEKALKESEIFFKESQRAASIGSYKTDFVTGRWESSEVLDAIFGIDREYTRSVQGWLDLVHPDDRDMMDQYLREEVIAKRNRFSKEYRIVRIKGGETRWVYGLGEVRFDGNGNPLSLTGTIQDITKRKQAEEALAAANRQIQSIVDNAPAIVYAFDLDERFVLANATVAKLLNSTPEQLIGKRRHDFMPQADADWHEANDRKVIEAGQALDFEEQSELPGRSITWLTTKFPLRDAADKIYAVGGISTDITERVQSEKDRAALAAIVESTEDAIIGKHLDGTITSWNTGAEHLFGYRSDEMIGQSISRIIPPELQDEETDILDKLKQGQPITHYETERLVKDGRRISISLTVSPIRDDSGVIFGASKIARDISERKLAEEALLRYELLARHSRDIILFMAFDSGQILEINAAAFAAYGYTREELLEKTIHDLRANDTRDVTATQMTESAHRGIQFETVHRRKDGSTFPVEVSSQGALIGKTQTLISVVRDITERKQAELALRESEERLRLLGDNLPENAVFQYAHDLDGGVRFIYVSSGIERLNGVTPEEVLRDAGVLHRQFPPEFIEQLIEAEALSKRELSDFDMELPMHRPDGNVRWMRLHSRPRRMSDGSTVWDGVQTDITERKQSEEHLRQKEERLRLALEAAKIATWDWHVPSGTVIWNDLHYRMMGYEPGEVRPSYQAWASRVHPDDVEAAQKRIQQSMGSGTVFTAEFRTRWPDGTVRWLEARGETEYSTNNEPQRQYGVMLDITERKQTEEALLRQSEAALFMSEQEFRSLAESMPQIVWATRPDGWNIYFNQQWVDYTGLTIEESYGHGWNTPFHPDDKQRAWDAWQRATQNNERYSVECRLRRADGVYRWWLVRGEPMRGKDGEILKWFGTCTDIEEIKLAEAELIDRSKELAVTIDHLQREMLERESAEKKLLEETTERLQATEDLREKERLLIQQSRQAAMGEMIGNIAHQWRQPLNTLGLYTQRLGTFYGMPNFNKEFLDNSIAKSMEIIKHMSKTIDDFRDYFKPEKEKADFHVIEAIKNTLSLLEGNFNDPKITIDFVGHDNPVINGYQNEFAQVFLNILINARDAIIERDIADARITITICSEDNCAVVTVSDNAGGVPVEIIDKVFDPYFTTKGPQVGTGIGLFMSKTIIEKNMGGRLSVRNTDTGAEFRIKVEYGNKN